MKPTSLAEGVYWVGAIDWDIRDFHGLATPRGSTYNSYLVVDDHVALIDAVHAGHFDSLMRHVSQFVDPDSIDYVISNHSEYDHTGALPRLMQAAPNARLLASQDGVKRLSAMYRQDLRLQSVADGEELALGRRTLRFLYAPLLHWPETMFTYCPEASVLFSCDAFGAHLATSERFADEVGVDNTIQLTRQYYAYLIHAYRKAVRQAMAKIDGLGIDAVAPSHGPVWRGRDIGTLMSHYRRWSQLELEDLATVVYGSMWGNTRSLVPAICDGLVAGGLRARAYDVQKSLPSDIIADTFISKLVLFGSPTFESGIYPPVEAFIPFMRIPRDRTKKVALFGSYGWSGGSIRRLQRVLGEEGYDVMEEALEMQFGTTDEDLEAAYRFGLTAAQWAIARLASEAEGKAAGGEAQAAN